MDMSSDTDRHNNDPLKEDVAVDNILSQELHKLDFNDNNADIGATHHENEHRDDDENDDDDDFTFVFIGDDENNSSPGGIYAFEEGQNFPLFDQKLLLDGTEYELEQVHDHQKYLPFQPPVNRVFTEMPPRGGSESSSSKKLDDHEEAVAGPYCEWSSTSNNNSSHNHDQNGLSKKSNSTGFSKLWRLREKVHRSNSDGRDAFVFLKHSSNDHKTTSSSSASLSTTKAVVSHGDDHGSRHGTFVKVNNNGNGSARKGPKVVKKTTISAHGAYMRSRGGHTEEERRKSYLPYRPELMGFFTNVHGGLSKNVHPY
uniref:AP2/ERF domain-containing protein PFD0985w-like n=1 Tax=Erigeron canadensis TaxID=72917 RepID=UPI001CB9D3E9|nr:AP2/ERF domain-containing protein PFD0985w-like [Erigeron canadensis]